MEEVKNKIPGNGRSIAGMVLGIIAIVWCLFQLMSFGAINEGLNQVSNYTNLEGISLPFIYFWFGFGYTLFSLIPSLIGLPLSISGLKKQKTGKNVTGIVLNTISLIFSIIVYVYIMSCA